MDRIAVTGIGVVSPAGSGRVPFAAAVAGVPPPSPATAVPALALEDHVPDARAFRRAARATRFTLAAAAMALEDAGLSGDACAGPRAGLVVCLTHGAMEYSTLFHKGLLLDGPLGASPLYFSESVLNAPAGNAAIAFGIRGPVHTLIGEETVGTEGVALAATLLRSGAVAFCLVAAAEEKTAIVEAAYRRMHRAAPRPEGPWESRPEPAEGAAALVLELEGAAVRRGAVVHAVLAGWALGAGRSGPMDEESAAAVAAAYRSAGLAPAAAGHVLPPTGGCRSPVERGAVRVLDAGKEPLERIDVAAHFGNPVGAANLLQAAASAALLSEGRVRAPGLILSSGMEGTVAALVTVRAGEGAS